MENFDIKKILLGIVIIIFVFFAFIFIRNFKESEPEDGVNNNKKGSEQQEGKQEEQKTQEELAGERINDVDNLNSAVLEEDYFLCKNIEESYTRDLCFRKVGEENSDNSACAYIEDKTSKDMCYFAIQKNKAFTEKSIEPCKELANETLINGCIRQVEASNFCGGEECFD
jgi:hypothetical protein